MGYTPSTSTSASAYVTFKATGSGYVNTNTTYTLGKDGNNLTLTPSSGSVQSVIPNYAWTAHSVDSITNNETGDNAVVSFTIGASNSFYKEVNNVRTARFAYSTNYSGITYDTYDSYSKDWPVLDNPYDDGFIANRLGFLEPKYISVAYSQDGGSTWTDSGYDSEMKRYITGERFGWTGIRIGVSSTGDWPSSPSDGQLMTKVDFTMPADGWGTYGRYCSIDKFMCWESGPHVIEVKLEYALQSDQTTFILWRDWTRVTGWSGPNSMSLPSKTTYGGGTSQVRIIRVTYRITTVLSGYSYTNTFGNLRFCGRNNWGGASKYSLPYQFNPYGDLYPRNIEDNYPSLGTNGTSWKDLYLRDSIFFGNTQTGMRITRGSNYYADVNCQSGTLWTFSDSSNISYRLLRPSANNTYDLGSSSYKWKDLYVNGTLNDGTNTTSIAALHAKVSSFAFELDQGDTEVITPDSTNHRITFNLNPGNNITISKGSGTNTVSYNISATNNKTVANGITYGSTSTISSATTLTYTGKSIAGGTYGAMYYIVVYTAGTSAYVAVCPSSSSSSSRIINNRMPASSSYYTISVLVPRNTTWYI